MNNTYTKQSGKYLYEYANNTFSVFNTEYEDKKLVTSTEVTITNEKEFDMELIYHSTNLPAVDAYGDYD